MWWKLFSIDYRIWYTLYAIAFVGLVFYGKKGLPLWVAAGFAMIIGLFAAVMVYFLSGEFFASIILKLGTVAILANLVSDGYTEISNRLRKK